MKHGKRGNRRVFSQYIERDIFLGVKTSPCASYLAEIREKTCFLEGFRPSTLAKTSETATDHKGNISIRLDEYFCKRVEILPSGDKRPSDRPFNQ